MKLIPVNEKEAIEFEKRLENTIYRSSEQFITMYNNRMFKDQLTDANKTARELTNHYKNVILKNKYLLVKSENEILLDSMLYTFNFFKPIVTLKRIANEMIDMDYDKNTKLIFNSKNINLLLIENNEFADIDKNKLEIKHFVIYENKEQIFKNAKELASNPFLRNLIYDYDENGEYCYFLIHELANIDDIFIKKINEYFISMFNEK